MSAKPLVEEMLASPSAAPAIALAEGDRGAGAPEASVAMGGGIGNSLRRVSIYLPRAAFDLVDELDFLTRRAIDQNVFFAPQFLIPAMPRLDERAVKLMVVRDEAPRRSRLRFLMPYSVERAGLVGGPATIRAWTHPFGPLGTPLLDADDPTETLASVLKAMSDPALALPGVLVLPDVRIAEPFAATLHEAAAALGLPVAVVNRFERAALAKGEAGEAGGVEGLSRSLPSKRRREVQRQRRMLDAKGAPSFEVARAPAAVRAAMEEFLVLEASGWKGRERSALIMDRYRAAFAREAVDKLGDRDRTRIFTLRLDGVPIASLVAFVVGGEAFAWKMAYDEAHAAASPGLQMLLMASDALIADPLVRRVDSCAVPDHALMNRLWRDRIAVGTLVVGLHPGAGRRVASVAGNLEAVRRARNTARLLRARLRSMLRRG